MDSSARIDGRFSALNKEKAILVCAFREGRRCLVVEVISRIRHDFLHIHEINTGVYFSGFPVVMCMWLAF